MPKHAVVVECGDLSKYALMDLLAIQHFPKLMDIDLSKLSLKALRNLIVIERVANDLPRR